MGRATAQMPLTPKIMSRRSIPVAPRTGRTSRHAMGTNWWGHFTPNHSNDPNMQMQESTNRAQLQIIKNSKRAIQKLIPQTNRKAPWGCEQIKHVRGHRRLYNARNVMEGATKRNHTQLKVHSTHVWKSHAPAGPRAAHLKKSTPLPTKA